MNTANQNYLGEMIRVQQSGETFYEYSPEAGSELHFDAETMSSLEKMQQDNAKLSKALDEYLDSMQETFVNTLLKQLTDSKAELKERLHLHLSPEGQLVVEGDENDAEKVCDVLSKQPGIQRRFKNLSYLAMLSHGVDVARQACQAMQASDEDSVNPLFSHYHIYIKGSLSHFCVRE